MDVRQKTTEYLLDAWEARRAIKNRMGYMSYYIVVKKHGELFRELWSSREDICLGTNRGWYCGREAVGGYYEAKTREDQLVGELFQKAFPTVLGDKTAEDVYGTGTMEYKPVECELVEVAGDLQTAKGLWLVRGSYSKATPAGPVGYWEWSWYAVDFIQENGQWYIWHMQYLTEVDAACGTDWISEMKPLPENEIFAPVKDFAFPEPTIPAVLRETYHPMRAFAEPPAMPEPYETFADTFSYGC